MVYVNMERGFFYNGYCHNHLIVTPTHRWLVETIVTSVRQQNDWGVYENRVEIETDWTEVDENWRAE
jgi:hypothetical protein